MVRVDARAQTLDVHALRATCATRLARSGAPLVATQRILGHSDPKLTARHYLLLESEDLRTVVEGIAATGRRQRAQAGSPRYRIHAPARRETVRLGAKKRALAVEQMMPRNTQVKTKAGHAVSTRKGPPRRERELAVAPRHGITYVGHADNYEHVRAGG